MQGNAGHPLADSLDNAARVNQLFNFPIAGKEEDGWTPATDLFLEK